MAQHRVPFKECKRRRGGQISRTCGRLLVEERHNRRLPPAAMGFQAETLWFCAVIT
jgi:hypothetical protein